jgi:hypothetical protein
VRKYLLRYYLQLADARIDYGWGGTLAVTMNRLLSFGRLDPDVYYALDFSGHGVQIATLAGKLIAEAIASTAERFDVMAHSLAALSRRHVVALAGAGRGHAVSRAPGPARRLRVQDAEGCRMRLRNGAKSGRYAIVPLSWRGRLIKRVR